METKEYCIIKLLNGEDIISQVSGLKQLENNIVYLTDPYSVKTFSVDKKGFQQVAISKWNPYTGDEKIALSLDNVLTISNCKEDLLQHYIQTSLREMDDDEPLEEVDVQQVTGNEEGMFDDIIELLRSKRNNTIH
jgi:hypothetical protein